MTKEEIIKLIKSTVEESAKNSAENAAYAGSHHDGGASRMLTDFTIWVDGVEFATTGKTKQYGHIVDKAEKMADVEYQEYLRLKEKFKGVV